MINNIEKEEIKKNQEYYNNLINLQIKEKRTELPQEQEYPTKHYRDPM